MYVDKVTVFACVIVFLGFAALIIAHFLGDMETPAKKIIASCAGGLIPVLGFIFWCLI